MQQTFIIGSREFTAVMPNVLDANSIMMRAKKKLMPSALKLLSGGDDVSSLNNAQLMVALADALDEETIDELVLPFFNHCKVYLVEEKRFLRTKTDVNSSFTMSNFFEFYELVFEVARFVFPPFFEAAMSRFGVQTQEGQQNKGNTEN